MPTVKIIISDDGKELMDKAAKKDELSFSAWARSVLLAAARSSAPDSKVPVKKRMTQAEIDSQVAARLLRERMAEGSGPFMLPASVQAELDAMD